jgi:tetratricopeptide (TPR) repeat protein
VVCLTLNCGAGTKLHSCWPYIPGKKATPLRSPPHYLPLAIVQAASYINENKETFAVYLKLLSEQEEEVVELLSENFEDEERYPDIKNPVAMTFLISFDYIRGQDALAAEYLSFVACISPKDVPLSLLPQNLSLKKKTDALGTLKAYSFITRHSNSRVFDVHRLVHLATRNWLEKENLLTQWTQKATAQLAQLFPRSDEQNRIMWRSYMPHGLYVLDSKLLHAEEKSRIELAWKVARCLYNDGRWKEAEYLIGLVMEIQKKVLGPEHPDTLLSMGLFALLLKCLGKYDEAEPIYRQTLELTKKVHGLEHPETLRSMGNLAGLLRSRDKYEEAEPMYRQTLQLQKKILGPEHPETLTGMNNLGLLLYKQRKYEEAEPILRQTLRLRTQILGLEHPRTLTSMNNLALLLYTEEKYGEAELMYKDTVELGKKILGPEHPHILSTIKDYERCQRDLPSARLHTRDEAKHKK